MAQKPLLVRSGLTDRVYVVTRYKRGPHGIVAQSKSDVTDQFIDVAFELGEDWWNAKSEERADPEGSALSGPLPSGANSRTDDTQHGPDTDG